MMLLFKFNVIHFLKVPGVGKSALVCRRVRSPPRPRCIAVVASALPLPIHQEPPTPPHDPR